MSLASSAESSSTRLRRRHAAYVAVLLLGALLVYLLGNNLFPLVDRDEPRYAQASRQMLESGDWTTPQFLDEMRLKKPVGLYWLQATSMALLGDTPFAARLPSALATVATLALLSATLPGIVGHRRAFWATFIFATALLPTYLAKIAMTDAVLQLWIAGAMLCLYAIWRGDGRWRIVVALGACAGVAVLTKGPPVFLYLGMTLVALWLLNRTVRGPAEELRVIEVERAMPAVALKVCVALAILLTICLPWAMRLEARHPGVIGSMLMKEVVARGRTGQEGHSGPPGFYLVTILGTWFPWSLMLPAAIWQGWRRRHVPWVRFSLAAVLGPWIFLEFYRTKLPHYLLPSYPFLAILTADVLLRSVRGATLDLRDRPFLLATGAVGILATAIAFVVLILPPWFGGAVWPGLLLAVLIAVGIGWAARYVYNRVEEGRLLPAAAAMGLSLWGVTLLVFGLYWPLVPSLRLAQRVGTDLHERMIDRPGPAQMAVFKEPSLAFYQGGTIREASDEDFLQTTPRDQWPRWLVIPAESWRTQPARVQDRWTEAASTFGLNLASNDSRLLTVLTLENRDWFDRHPTTVPALVPPTTQP